MGSFGACAKRTTLTCMDDDEPPDTSAQTWGTTLVALQFALLAVLALLSLARLLG